MSMISEPEVRAAANAPAPKFVPLTEYIGCEVSGIDLRQPVSPANASAIYRAWLDDAVVVPR